MKCSECDALKIAFADAIIEAFSVEARLTGCPVGEWKERWESHQGAEAKKWAAYHAVQEHQEGHR